MTAKQGLYDPAYEHDACGIGFVAHIHGVRSRDIVAKSLQLLVNLSHRSAVAGDGCTGDGAGILLQVPHVFLRRACAFAGIPLTDAGTYGVGMVFMPSRASARATCERLIEQTIASEGYSTLGWRDVPVDDSVLSPSTKRTRPVIRQVFVARLFVDRDISSDSAFEVALYKMRRKIEAALRATPDGADCYFASFSSRTIIYKGMLTPDQLPRFYRDLQDPDLASAIALVHSRFSTNTFPSWRLAHPYRFLCHNGEINTLRGNLNWMRVREATMSCERFDGRFDELFPVCAPNQSDSASVDNVLEMLTLAGRPLAHAMAMIIPEAWESHATMSPDRRAFYEYHSSLMEPWDGPAAMAFTDGRSVAAVLDRNGLRPARYVVTTDDLVVLASEAGALPIATERIRAKGRLEPGRMFVVNTTTGQVLDDEAIKTELAMVRPYGRWVAEHRLSIDDLRAAGQSISRENSLPLFTQQRLFGYTADEIKMVLGPMADAGEEPAGSMGNDTPLAVLSDRPQLLFAYFRQMFAQVTNPAIDPMREQLVMSLAMNLGPQGNLLEVGAEHARQIRIAQPVLTESDVAALRSVTEPSLRAVTLSTVFDTASGAAALAPALEALCLSAADAVREQECGVLILSDRAVDESHAPIPAALAVAAVHHHLIREGLRGRVSLVAETGEAREVSHIAHLISYGASAVHPYLALETVDSLAAPTLVAEESRRQPAEGHQPPASNSHAAEHYIKAVGKGLLKIMSKMGISTLQSYCGAQLWEAVGLSSDLIQKHFTGTPSRVGGIGLELIAEETLRRHAAAFDDTASRLDAGGEYQFRIQGEHHNWNPLTISKLQHATRTDNYSTFKEFSKLANDETRRRATLRGLLDFVAREPIPIDDVEPAKSITRRFTTGAMSFGSLSAEAHQTLAIAMNSIGGRSNSGEGGEERSRFGTERNSAIKQVASARFGVTAEYLMNAQELQIKIAQGAKPGEGGQLPGHKVDAIIAKTRHSIPGVTLISPPPHHDIYSIEDLAQLIYDLKAINPQAAVSVKLVAEAGVGTIAAGVAKARADLICISGDSGGTGASPLSSIMRAGSPWELGLSETQQTLVKNNLRGRVRVQTDGQLKTGRDVVVAAMLGADEFGFATAPLIVEGCILMRKCHLNTCPVGIATQDPELRARFAGQPEHVVNYFFFVAEEVREILAQLGVRTLDEVIGRTDLLNFEPPNEHAKARTLDLSAMLWRDAGGGTGDAASGTGDALSGQRAAESAKRVVRHYMPRAPRPSQPEKSLNAILVEVARPALEKSERVTASLPITNADRAVGATLSGEIAKRFGDEGLPENTVSFRFTGSAGQSFGAFAARGLTLELEGEANDYVGKGLSGGRLIVRHPRTAQFIPDQTVLIGNTVLYGATSGEAYFAGTAGERFAVRNSGAITVVEGVGDHGCEYMTGGTVVVLGRIGRNFAAGMSGGLAFVLDEFDLVKQHCNLAMVDLIPVADLGERDTLRHLVEQHARYTGSARAKRLLSQWDRSTRNFYAVMPREYRAALERQRDAEQATRIAGGRGGLAIVDARIDRHG
jgi:glutamate synthase (NADPH/NADH) large chain